MEKKIIGQWRALLREEGRAYALTHLFKVLSKNFAPLPSGRALLRESAHPVDLYLSHKWIFCIFFLDVSPPKGTLHDG